MARGQDVAQAWVRGSKFCQNSVTYLSKGLCQRLPTPGVREKYEVVHLGFMVVNKNAIILRGAGFFFVLYKGTKKVGNHCSVPFLV